MSKLEPTEIGEAIPRLPVKKPRPKGLAPYVPRSGSKNQRAAIAAQAVIERYQAEGRLPLGSRETGYVFTGEPSGEWTKADIDLIEDVIVRERRAGRIPFGAISDGRTYSSKPWTVRDPEEVADTLLGELVTAQVDRQSGQRHRVEVWAEAAGWVSRLEGDCHERGVPVYSGSGSVPVDAIRKAALRAIYHWSEAEQSTVILSIGDLDLSGIRNIARPFEEDLIAFVVDLLGKAGVVAPEGATEILTVRRLLITAEQVEEHVPERARGVPTAEAVRQGWPYPYTAQAEALLPEVRDRIVAVAIDDLHDIEQREAAIAAEAALHAEARSVLADKLNADEEGEGSR